MKKLLGVSIAAMLAVSPMLAHATGEVYSINGQPAAATSEVGTAENLKASASAPYASVDATPTTDIATTSYVKGAYNAAIQAVNKVADDSKTSGGDGIAKAADGTLSVDLSSNKGLQIDSTNHTLEVKAANGIELSSSGVGVKAKTNGGITVDSDGVSLTNGIINTDNSTYSSETQLTTQGYVDAAVAGVTSTGATQTGVVATINKSTASATVPVFGTWGSNSSTGNVTVTSDVMAPGTNRNEYYATYSGTATTVTAADAYVAPSNP